MTDINSIHELHSLAETDEFNTLGIPDTIETTEKIVVEWLSGQNTMPRTFYVFCLENIDTKQFVGLIALNLGKPKFSIGEVWYKIHVDNWSKGYTTEALTRILDFGFNELFLHRIEAGCAVENIASCKVLEKVGMVREGMKRKILPIRGEWIDGYIYAILDQDFYNMRNDPK